MATLVKMPKLGLTMTEGTIVKWLKKEGETVEKGEPLLEILTDKATLEEESPASGILKKVLYQEGAVVGIGKTIAVIAKEDEDIAGLDLEGEYDTPPSEKGKNAAGIQDRGEKKPVTASDRVKASPAAKRRAREEGIDIGQVQGTGPGGRIIEQDIIDFVKSAKTKVSPTAEKIAVSKGIDVKEIVPEKGIRVMKEDVLKAVGRGKKTPLSGMRKIIADKMVLSKNTIPHYYVSMDVDMTEAVRLRENINGFLKDSDIKLSYNDILIKASSLAIREFPVVNSYVDGEAVVFKEEINIGIAVALEDGLIVPVIKNADKKGLKQIAFEREQLIEKARTNKLLPDEFSGGSFTISSLGMFGVDRFTAIINHPETAILAVGRIKKQPVVEKDNIVIRPIMNLTLSADHRVIDGALAAAFLNKIKEYLENPFLQLMES